MEVRVESSRLIKPAYESGEPPVGPELVRLSIFDNVSDDGHFAAVCAFRPPNPSNSAWERSLRKVLVMFREWAGRFGTDADGNPAILLNDMGVRLVEASVDCSHDEFMPSEQSPVLLSLHPFPYGVEELAQVQLTRFTCGTLVVGFTFHHKLGDGYGTTHFLVSWAWACQGIDIDAGPVHDRSMFFIPRVPPRVEFEHRSTEYKKKGTTFTSGYEPTCDTVVQRAHFSKEFLNKMKATASLGAGGRKYTTFESLMAHLWRTVTKARGLKGDEAIRLRIAVNGRARLEPAIPDEYFGNLVLWAFCHATAGEVVTKPLCHVAEMIHREIAKVNDRYYKSFIDFATSGAVQEEELEPLTDPCIRALYPDVDVNSWLGFPMRLMDFGTGSPEYFIPSYLPMEGLLFVIPSFHGEEGSVDAYVPLFEDNVESFEKICYSLEDSLEISGWDDADASVLMARF